MTNRLTYLLLILPTIFFGQTNKTFNDTAFRLGDIIAVPEILYATCLGGEHVNDSTFKKLSYFINSHPNMVFEIGTHTDTRGKANCNYTLSMARSENIKSTLTSNYNVATSQVKTSGYGASRPLVADSTIKKVKTKVEKEELHQKNRRTELKVIEIK